VHGCEGGHKGWKGIFCGYTDDDLKTAMIYVIHKKKIKCVAYDCCRWVYGNLTWKLSNPSTSWDGWRDALSGEDEDEESESETEDEGESDDLQEPQPMERAPHAEMNDHAVGEEPVAETVAERRLSEEDGKEGLAEEFDLSEEEVLALRDAQSEPESEDEPMDVVRRSSRSKPISEKAIVNLEQKMNRDLDDQEKMKRKEH